MPTPAEGLTPESSEEAIGEAVSACISQLADEHPEWDNDRRVAACHEMARGATGGRPAERGVGRRTSRRIGG